MLEAWTHAQIVVGMVAGLAIGASKTGVPGLTIVMVPVTAMAFGGKTSVGLVLPCLIVADCCALYWYRRHAEWHHLRAVAPWVVPGLLAGAAVLFAVDHLPGMHTDWFKPIIGGVILAMLGILCQSRRSRSVDQQSEPQQTEAGSSLSPPQARTIPVLTGVGTGFATTLANAAGPIMSMYFTRLGLAKHDFVGTSAWFFFVLNVTKVPVFAALTMWDQQGTALFTRDSLALNVIMIPTILLGAWCGKTLLPYLSQRLFERVVLLFAFLAAMHLLLSPLW